MLSFYKENDEMLIEQSPDPENLGITGDARLYKKSPGTRSDLISGK